MRLTHPRAALAAILLLYLVLASLYAVYTPAWQAPDEPAHYNYVRYVAQNGQFPVLHMGDYPHGYLEQIKERKFPPGMAIDNIRYESHQPPLYYVLAAAVFTVARGALLPLRLLSVALGACLVLVVYALAHRIFPARPGLALAAAAFVAFLPQHLASVAQVGNDTLAELFFAIALLQLTGWVVDAGPRCPAAARTAPASAGNSSADPAGGQPLAIDGKLRILALGVLLGLILITKTTAYIALPLAVGVVIWDGWHRGSPAGPVAGRLALLALPSLLIALPWYVRGIDVYGWPDVLGLRMHDLVVVGQTRTAEYLAQHGAAAYVERLVSFTFRSFWGMFGWLGVSMDARVYTGLALLCLVVAGGLVLHERQARRPEALTPGQRYALRLLAVSALFTLLAYAWYNLQFVQHQGRYLFTALAPIAVAFALGWDEAAGPGAGRRSPLLLAALLVVAAGVIGVWGIGAQQALPKWPIALALAGAAFLALRGTLLTSRPVAALSFALPYAALPLVALYGLFGAIVPQLAR